MSKLLMAIALLALTGCVGNNNLAQFTANDTATAANIANAVGDVSGATCWAAFNKLAVAAGGSVNMAASPSTYGIAAAIEIKRAAAQVLETSCGPLTAAFLINVLHGAAGPFAGLIP